MKILIDMYDLGWKVQDLTEAQILEELIRTPQYRDKLYMWTNGGYTSCSYTCTIQGAKRDKYDLCDLCGYLCEEYKIGMYDYLIPFKFTEKFTQPE